MINYELNEKATIVLLIAGSDIGKLETTPVDLSKLSNVVKNEVVEQTVYDELLKKFNAIQTTD